MARKFKYHTILTRENDAAPWCPQFGDRDLQVVRDEMRDSFASEYAARNRRIITTDGTQKAINEAVAALNFVATHIVLVHVS